MSYGRDHGLRCTPSAHAKYWFVAALFAAQPIAQAATFTVTSTADTGGSTCAATCTLRQAINAANAAAGADTINFNITGAGLHTIALLDLLPAITAPITIDGYSQPGSAVNTASVGSNAALKIALDGSAIPIGGGKGSNGLVFDTGSAPSSARGLLIYGFRAFNGNDGSGVAFVGPSTASSVKGCFIGVDPSGAKPNRGSGILVLPPAAGVLIGSSALADRNLVSGNLQGGIALLSSGAAVLGNLIGTAADGVSLFGNGAYGVGVLGGSGNAIGGTVSGAGNTIAGNSLVGVLVASPGAGNKIEGNAIYGNGGLGIDLSNAVGGTPDGVTANDAGDADTGANNFQNFPVLTGAGLTAGGGTLGIQGTLNSTASRTFRIEFFANTVADPSGFGEGQRFIGSTNVMTDASGNAGFTILGAAGGVVSRQIITATATDTVTGDTSEFSAGTVVTATTTVVNTNDSGQGSLRQAILNANSHAGADTIDFAIPGAGVHTIHPLTSLPTITDTVTIDGYTQLGAAVNALVDGDDAIIAVHLDGSNIATVGGVGLAICAPDSIIRGVAITGFSDGSGVNVGADADNAGCASGAGAADNSAIEGNYIGLLPDGTTVAPNLNGVNLFGKARIGGADSGQRNVISGNSGTGIFGGGFTGASIDGNYLGTDATGQSARGNGAAGIYLTNGVSGALVGVQARNRIAYNHQNGIMVSASTANRIAANDIHDNTGLGIDLCKGIIPCPDGVTLNDTNDTDFGGNNLQNFPNITGVLRTATGLSISGTLDRPATAGSLTFDIGVYASTACDPSGFGQGEHFLGTFNFVSANASIETFTNVAFPTTAPLPVGTLITLTATDPAGNTSEFSHCSVLDTVIETFVVNSALDTDGPVCISDCTLREAINAANAHIGGDIIAFNIPGNGVHVISPVSALPTISDAVTIDGYTQPGASPNTLAEGDNAKIMIRIDGLSAPGSAFGFAICANDTALRGLSVTRFNQSSVEIGSNSAGTGCGHVIRGVHIDGNFIGLAPDGSAAGNQGSGIFVNGSVAQVGGSLPSERNVVSANGAFGGIGVISPFTAGTVIAGNYIGTDPSGTLDRGNVHEGVAIATNASGVIVGGAAPNRIAFNRNGIMLDATSKANVLFGNDMFANDTLAIDLVASGGIPDGATPNDPDDGDSGGNDLQNFPVLTSATLNGQTIRVVGALDVPAGSTSNPYALAFYATSANCNASTRGQGDVYLGHANVPLSGAQQEFVVDLPGSAPIGSNIDATATSAGGTSEFSTCVTLVGGDLIFANGFD